MIVLSKYFVPTDEANLCLITSTNFVKNMEYAKNWQLFNTLIQSGMVKRKDRIVSKMDKTIQKEQKFTKHYFVWSSRNRCLSSQPITNKSNLKSDATWSMEQFHSISKDILEFLI